MRHLRLRTPLELGLGMALVVAVGIILHQHWQLAGSRRDHERDQRSMETLQTALHQCQQQAQVAPEVAPPAPVDSASLAQRNATIHELNRELSEAHIAAQQLQMQLASARDERDKALQSADDRLRKMQTDIEGQLTAVQQKLDSTAAELQASRQRNMALEGDNAKLRSDAGEGAGRAAEFQRLAASLDDVNRRRDTFLTSLVRRYRDVTSQLRGMSGMLDASREQNSGACSGEALARIQNVVSQADDDLRQLNDLNAEARQIEKKLMKK